MKELQYKVDNIDKYLQELKIHHEKKGVTTEAEFLQSLVQNQLFIPATPHFQDFLRAKAADYWIEARRPTFPAKNSSEKAICQPFMTQVLEHFVSADNIPDNISISHYRDHIHTTLKNLSSKRKKSDAEKDTILELEGWRPSNLCKLPSVTLYTKNFLSSSHIEADIYSIADPYAFDKQSFGRRKPDIVLYSSILGGPLDITFLGEVKGRSGDLSFPDQEVGHIIDITRDLLENYQVHRSFCYAFLTDCQRFQFFKLTKSQSTLTYEYSRIFHGLEGWNVSLSYLSVLYLLIPIPILILIHITLRFSFV